MESAMMHTKELQTTLRVGAVLLAAGEGSRMGSVPKSLLVLDGVPLIRRHLAAMREAELNDVVVVTGYHYEPIEAAIIDTTARVIRNLAPQRGQQSSVRLGASALDPDCDLVMVVLADQPLIGTAELQELVRGFMHRPPGAGVLYPVVGSQRGNPVVFSGEVIATMLASGSDADFRRFIDEHPAVVYRYSTDNEHFIIDLDTTEDIGAFEQRTGLTLQWPDGLA
jgi:CTP:molybdopterin cytidylyltransferase MocA